MLIRGDFDLNTAQRDPVEAMLKQEVVFGHQVHELHRLSSTRRSFTMVGNELDTYNSRNVKARPSYLPPRDATRYGLLAKDARFSAATEVRSGENSRQSRERSVNLQLSADDFIHRSGESLQAKGSIRNRSFMTREELKLSLGTGNRSRMPGVRCALSTRFDKGRDMKNAVVIDLEDSSEKKTGRMPNTWLDRNRNLSRAVVIDLEDSVEQVQHGYERVDDKIVIDLEDSLENKGPIDGDASLGGRPSGGQWLATSERGDLDLNEAYQGDSCNSKPDTGNVVANGALLDLNMECELEMEEESDTRIGSIKCEIDTSGSKTSLVELKSTPMKPLLLDDLNHMPTEDGETSCGTSGVEDHDHDHDQDRVSFSMDESQNASLQERNGNKSPASCKSCISDNDSTGIKQEEEEEEPVKVDTLIKRAAVSLLYLTLDDSTKDQPQHSLDSYEMIAMELTQNIVDVEDSASSGAFEVDFSEEKDQGSKWKRGRRLKDFQREILPCLASLSRHEIREDINILEGVLRSREYRRMQAMAGGGQHQQQQQQEAKRKRSRRNGTKPT
ncbi:hypothetical protein LINPERPRIM_LOCUS36018 [Linum perenne]